MKQSLLKFTNLICDSETAPVCLCHSDKYCRTLVVFAVYDGDDASYESVVICLSDRAMEMDFDGGESPQEIEDLDDVDNGSVVQVRDTNFAIQDIRLSCDSLFLASQTPKEILLFHSSEFFCCTDESSSPIKVSISYQ